MRLDVHREAFARLLLFAIFGLLFLSLPSAGPAQEAGAITLWVKRNFSSWENPLHSEVHLNGELLNIFSSDSFEPIQPKLKEGWNVVTVVTRPQEPASEGNDLIFRIGPMVKDAKANTMVMTNVLWQFRNGTDWKFANGTYSHPLGPNVKEVKLEFPVYWVGLDRESQELKEGDYVLIGKSTFENWNSPVTGTVFLNGTPFNSFMLGTRQIVVTSLIKPGKNELKLVSNRIVNSIEKNDIEISLAGPAEWNVSRNEFVVTPILEAKAGQGWQKDSKSGQLVNPAAPTSSTIERVIPFVIKQAAP
jgi:hypothetical protein